MNETENFADNKMVGESSYFQEHCQFYFVLKGMKKNHICASMYPVKTRQKAKKFTSISFFITIEIQFLSYLKTEEKKGFINISTFHISTVPGSHPPVKQRYAIKPNFLAIAH